MNATGRPDDGNVPHLHTGDQAIDAEFDTLMRRFEQLDEQQLEVLYDEADHALAHGQNVVAAASAISRVRVQPVVSRMARASGALRVAVAGAVLLADRTASGDAIPSTTGTNRTWRERTDEPWQLVAAAQEGDTEAFGQLYDRFVDMVFRYVLFRVGGDRAFAENVTSETFLRALRSIETVTYQGRDVGAWFVTIARNIVFDHVKSSRHQFEVTTAELRDAQESGSDPEPTVMAAGGNEELLRCISQLGNDQRRCITLRFIEGKSVAETADLMNRSDVAVKALQGRAVRRLAEILPSWLR